MQVNFGLTATDYRLHRRGIPFTTLQRLQRLGVGLPEQRVLDLGTGTGDLALQLAVAGAHVVALDVSAEMLRVCGERAQAGGLRIRTVCGTAEDHHLPSHFFQVVTCAQAWHWFERSRAIEEVQRVLQADGKLALVYFDWLSWPGSLVEATEALVLHHNPGWNLAGREGLSGAPRWMRELRAAGFTEFETFSFDEVVPYSHDGWRGRLRASAGVGASLPAAGVAAFDRDLHALLERRFPDPLMIPHRLFALVASCK